MGCKNLVTLSQSDKAEKKSKFRKCLQNHFCYQLFIIRRSFICTTLTKCKNWAFSSKHRAPWRRIRQKNCLRCMGGGGGRIPPPSHLLVLQYSSLNSNSFDINKCDNYNESSISYAGSAWEGRALYFRIVNSITINTSTNV